MIDSLQPGALVGGQLFFVGNAWRRRTNTFKAVTSTSDEKTAIVKHSGSFRPYDEASVDEEKTCRRIYPDGEADISNIAPLRCSELLRCVRRHEGRDALRARIGTSILPDPGAPLLEAETANHLLTAVYDVLEVHRMRNGLHRNICASNIPVVDSQCAQVEEPKGMRTAPLFIEDVVRAVARPIQERRACCLLIDMDRFVLLNPAVPPSPTEELESRARTPMFTSRSACVRSLFISAVSMKAEGMPELTGDALHRYNAVHGPARYDKYPPEPTVGGAKQHGFTPPPICDYTWFESNVKYVHRPEQDVESVFWTMLYALLLVKPADGKPEKYASTSFSEIWGFLDSHSIKEDAGTDCRNIIFDQRGSMWIDAFDGCMRDVAIMLCKIGNQVKTEWAFWEDSASVPDHLHEAVQRIILQYLVDHWDDDVALLPGQTRSTTVRPPGRWSRSPGPERTHGQSSGRHLTDAKTCGSGETAKTEANSTHRAVSGTSSFNLKKLHNCDDSAAAGPPTIAGSSWHPREDDDEPPRKRRKGPDELGRTLEESGAGGEA